MKKILLILAVTLSSYRSYAQFNSSSGNTTTSDKVGIGSTSSPFGQLDIWRPANNGVIARFATQFDAGQALDLAATQTSTGNGYFSFDLNSSNLGWRNFVIPAGNVGIGTTSPTATLQVGGNMGGVDNRNFKVTYPGGGGLTNTELSGLTHLSSELGLGWTALYAKQGYASYAAVFNGTTYFTNGNVGIGTATPVAKLEILGAAYGLPATSGATQTGLVTRFRDSRISGDVVLDIGDDASDNAMWLQSTDMRNLAVNYNLLLNPNGGNVGIGTTDPQGYRLAVNGNAIAESVTVKLHSNWPDYVFNPHYKLPPLSDVKSYIDKNQHLLDMPSEQEVKDNGINLGEIVKVQTKKIEELTLYLIEKDKQLTDQQKRNKKQDDRIAALEKILSKLMVKEK